MALQRQSPEPIAPLALPLTCRPSHDTSLDGWWLIEDAKIPADTVCVLRPDPGVEWRAHQIVAACNQAPVVDDLVAAVRGFITCLQYVDRVHPRLTGLAERLDAIAAGKAALERVENGQ